MARLTSTLSAAERERAARFGTTALRERYITGRAILRQLLGNAMGVSAGDVPIVRAHRGRPTIDRADAIDFNVSHTGDIGLFALGTGLAPGVRVGIDVEHARREARVDRLARKLLNPWEQEVLMRLSENDRHQRFIRTWTCKEAMSKATGDGLAAPFRFIAVESDDPPRVVDGPHPYTPDRWQLHRIPMPDSFVVTVALWHSVDKTW